MRIAKGDFEGHPFRGNQWTSGGGSADEYGDDIVNVNVPESMTEEQRREVMGRLVHNARVYNERGDSILRDGAAQNWAELATSEEKAKAPGFLQWQGRTPYGFMKILKRDDDKRLVFGFASVAVNVDGSPLTDSQGDQIEPAELERAAYDYVLKSREGAEMHSRRNVARIVESFVVTPEKLAKMGLASDAVPCGWWIGMKISDDATWSKVQKGELRAFSIGGKARRQEVD